jgi:hypothetical protein
MSGETLPASATTCTTLHPHDRFSFALWPRHAASPRRIDPWPAFVDPYEHLVLAVPPPVSSLPDTARRQDPIAAGETGVSARRDLRRHVGLILIVRHPYVASCPFCTYIGTRISDLLLPFVVFCCLLLEGRIIPRRSVPME